MGSALANTTLSDPSLVDEGASAYGILAAALPLLAPFSLMWVIPIAIIVMLLCKKYFGTTWWKGLLIGWIASMPVTYYIVSKGTRVIGHAAPMLLAVL